MTKNDMKTVAEDSLPPADMVLAAMAARFDGWEQQREVILAEVLKAVAFDGWTPMMLRNAAGICGVARGDLALIFPGGLIDVIEYWAETTDRHMLESMTTQAFDSLKIREKVTFAVRCRLEHLAAHHEAARRAAATLALPIYGTRGAKISWRTADYIWRGLGDSSTDFNYYSKRTILVGVLTSTFAKWLADDSDNFEATWSFLDKRIANVMEIEKVKAGFKKREWNPDKLIREGLIPALSKLRYPSF